MIVVCGEALMDVFDSGAHAHGQALDARLGGSPFNVAVGLARLGQPVAFCGALSSGFLGQRLARALAEEGVHTGCVQRVDAPTSMCVVGLDPGGVPRYDFLGAGGADRFLSTAVLEQIPADTRAIQVGSYAMVVEPVATTQRALVQREHSRRLIAYDPNVRLVVEPALARWREALAWMLPHTHLLKISEEDLGLLFPGQSPDDAAARWLRAGVKWVVVTRGEHGALAWLPGGERVEASPVAVTVIDTVGAGDTFQAALLTWLAENRRLSIDGVATLRTDDVRAALAFAAQAAALTCSRRGADLPRRAEIHI